MCIFEIDILTKSSPWPSKFDKNKKNIYTYILYQYPLMKIKIVFKMCDT